MRPVLRRQPRASDSRTFALPCGSLRTPKRQFATRSDKTEAGATPAAIHRGRSKIKYTLRARKKFFRSRKSFFLSRKTVLLARKPLFLSRSVSLRARKIILLSRESILRACKAAFRSRKIVLRSPKTDWCPRKTRSHARKTGIRHRKIAPGAMTIRHRSAHVLRPAGDAFCLTTSGRAMGEMLVRR